MIKIQSAKLSYGINFPTSVKEITPEILTSITENVKLPKHYCIVALLFKTKVFDFCTMISSNRNATIGVTPVLAKIYDEDSQNINAVVGDKIVIDRTSLERGVQLKLPIMISSDNARNYFSKDDSLVKAIMTKDYEAITNHKINKQLIGANSPDIIIAEFKIVPVNDIYASMPIEYDVIDPFKVVDDNLN